MISLIRCDDRLIHGQCMTRLVPHFKINHIIVIDQFTAGNTMMTKIIESMALPGMKNEVFKVEEATPAIKKAIDDDSKTLIVFRFPVIAKQIFDISDELPKELMVGPVQKKEGAKTIQDGTYCTKEDFDAFDYVQKNGVKVYFQVVPGMRRMDWTDIRSKFL